MFRLLQEMRANFGKLALLLGRDDWLRLVQSVGNEVMQLLPVIQLEREQAKLCFELLVSHGCDSCDCSGGTPTSSSVSSNFCRLSINRCAHGSSNVATCLKIPSPKKNRPCRHRKISATAASPSSDPKTA